MEVQPALALTEGLEVTGIDIIDAHHQVGEGPLFHAYVEGFVPSFCTYFATTLLCRQIRDLST